MRRRASAILAACSLLVAVLVAASWVRSCRRFDTLFGTPHGVDLASLCAAARVPHLQVGSLPELEQALAMPNGGIEVVEARVRRDDRRELDEKIRALALP